MKMTFLQDPVRFSHKKQNFQKKMWKYGLFKVVSNLLKWLHFGRIFSQWRFCQPRIKTYNMRHLHILRMFIWYHWYAQTLCSVTWYAVGPFWLACTDKFMIGRYSAYIIIYLIMWYLPEYLGCDKISVFDWSFRDDVMFLMIFFSFLINCEIFVVIQ